MNGGFESAFVAVNERISEVIDRLVLLEIKVAKMKGSIDNLKSDLEYMRSLTGAR